MIWCKPKLEPDLCAKAMLALKHCEYFEEQDHD